MRQSCICPFQKLKFVPCNFFRLILEDLDPEAMCTVNPYEGSIRSGYKLRRIQALLYPKYYQSIVDMNSRALPEVVIDYGRYEMDCFDRSGLYDCSGHKPMWGQNPWRVPIYLQTTTIES